ncbi:hypothetical protein H9185_001185 [Listeria monocytogenes]|nr:hypothetical protein [Listeria monocytogenes]
MTTIEAIRFFEFVLHCVGRANMQHKNKTSVQAFQLALAALQDQYSRENSRQLTIEDLKRINAPVWLSCFTLEGDPGYWCLCQKGIIICPSGQSFNAEEIPHWKFYIHKPKEDFSA